MAEYWKVTHRHRPYNIIPVAFYVTLEGKIPRTPLMYDYRHVYREENSILVAPLLKYTDYDIRGNHGTMTYRRGKNAVYSYTFYKDINSNL